MLLAILFLVGLICLYHRGIVVCSLGLGACRVGSFVRMLGSCSCLGLLFLKAFCCRNLLGKAPIFGLRTEY